MKHITILAALLLLSACQAPPTAPVTATAPESDVCGAQSRQDLVGTSASDLDRSRLPEDSRVLYPYNVATTDYRQERLNVLIDGAGKIESVSCG